MNISIVEHFQWYFSSESGPKFVFFWGAGSEGESIKDESWDPPLRNQSPPKHVIQYKECGDAPKNVFSRAWQENF